MKRNISVDMKELFKEVPKPVRHKVVKDLAKADYTPQDIAKLFGVSAGYISSLIQSELSDEKLKKLETEVTKLNKMKDMEIKALVKDLEYKAYRKLQSEVGDAKYSDVLKTAELLKSFSNQTLTQNNISIVMPDSVKKKFNVELPEVTNQPSDSNQPDT